LVGYHGSMDYGWVIAARKDVEAVLNNPLLQVRPSSAPVPEAMCGTVLGDVFRAEKLAAQVLVHRREARAEAALGLD